MPARSPESVGKDGADLFEESFGIVLYRISVIRTPVGARPVSLSYP